MSQPATTPVRVFVDIEGNPVQAGIGYVSERRGVVSTTFNYEAAYQALRSAYAVSPDLPLTSTRHHVTGLPGAFADSAPDRWGRNLIRKRILAQARADGRAAGTEAEVDYLLGVSDVTRQGALRFALDEGGPFLAADAGVPKLIELPRLLAAADRVATDGDDMAAVKVLLDAGSGSLGGARPKASARDGGRMLIAKFPHHSDEWDVMAWEKTALDLAERAGIPVPGRRLVDVGGRNVLLLDRFDRDARGRVGYISAMTLLSGTDGGSFDYLEVAEAMTEHGSSVRDDLAQLWRRIAFSVLVNNTDDHLRNHGFLRDGSGWRLSPAFDVNPEPDLSRQRVTSLGFTTDPRGCHAALFETGTQFKVSKSLADDIYDEVLTATGSWREVAVGNGVAEQECDRFAAAFDRFRSPDQ